MDLSNLLVKFQNTVISVDAGNCVYIAQLKKVLKNELSAELEGVGITQLQLHTSRDTEPLAGDVHLKEIAKKHDFPKPLDLKVVGLATVSERESKRLKFNDSPEESKEVAITKKGYDAEYVGRDLVVLPTLNVLNTYVKQWKAGGYHSPYTAVVGPSMVGKTRLILELAKEVCVVYICLRPLDSTGQPPRSLLANTILEPNVGNREEWYTSLIASILSVVAERFQTNKNLADWRSFNDSENFATSVTDRLKGALTGNHEKDLVAAEAGAKKALECIIKTPLKILLAFDEARSLLAVVEHGVCAFRAMRRALRKLPTSSCVYALFTDTTSKIANFTPPLKLDPSARPTSGLDSGKLFPPIYRIASFDAMVDNTDCCFNDLHSVARLLRYGVPFYHLYFEEAKQEGAADVNVAKHLVEFALMKLTFAKNSELEPVNLNVQQAFALLGATIKPYISASSSLSSELVSSHVAHCLHINPAREVILSAYPSQPIYAAAANQYLHKNPYSLVRCIKLLTMALRDGIVSRGDAGELASRIILLRAMQNIMGDQEDGALPYTKPVPLKTFLKELTGEEVEDLNLGAISEVNKKRLFSQGQIFWNHFTNVKYTPSSQELLKLMARGSAVQCKPLQRAFDQLFTVYLNDGSSGVMDCQKATFCGIQTKARKVDSQMRYAADKLTPEIAKMELNGENPYLVLYMSLDSSVGQGAPLLIKRRATDVRQASYGFRGIASFPFIRNDPSLLEALQELICADVDPLKMTEEDGKYFVLKTSPCVYKSN